MSKFWGNDVWPMRRPAEEVTLTSISHPEVTKADIIRAHPDLHPREIRRRYGISVNHVRVQRAQDKKSGKLK